MPIFSRRPSQPRAAGAVFHNDTTPDAPGDFMFIHSDCELLLTGGGESSSTTSAFTTSRHRQPSGQQLRPARHRQHQHHPDARRRWHRAERVGFDWPATRQRPDGHRDRGRRRPVRRHRRRGRLRRDEQLDACSARTRAWTGVRMRRPSRTTAPRRPAPRTPLNQVVSQGLLSDGSCYQWTLGGHRRERQRPRPSRPRGSSASTRPASSVEQPQHTFEVLGPRCRRQPVGQRRPPATSSARASRSSTLPIRGSSVSIGLTYNSQDTAERRHRPRLAAQRAAPADSINGRRHGHLHRRLGRAPHVHPTDRRTGHDLHPPVDAVRDPGQGHPHQRRTSSS